MPLQKLRLNVQPGQRALHLSDEIAVAKVDRVPLTRMAVHLQEVDEQPAVLLFRHLLLADHLRHNVCGNAVQRPHILASSMQVLAQLHDPARRHEDVASLQRSQQHQHQAVGAQPPT